MATDLFASFADANDFSLVSDDSEDGTANPVQETDPVHLPVPNNESLSAMNSLMSVDLTDSIETTQNNTSQPVTNHTSTTSERNDLFNLFGDAEDHSDGPNDVLLHQDSEDNTPHPITPPIPHHDEHITHDHNDEPQEEDTLEDIDLNDVHDVQHEHNHTEASSSVSQSIFSNFTNIGSPIHMITDTVHKIQEEDHINAHKILDKQQAKPKLPEISAFDDMESEEEQIETQEASTADVMPIRRQSNKPEVVASGAQCVSYQGMSNDILPRKYSPVKRGRGRGRNMTQRTQRTQRPQRTQRLQPRKVNTIEDLNDIVKNTMDATVANTMDPMEMKESKSLPQTVHASSKPHRTIGRRPVPSPLD
eukprot:371224_1